MQQPRMAVEDDRPNRSQAEISAHRRRLDTADTPVMANYTPAKPALLSRHASAPQQQASSPTTNCGVVANLPPLVSRHVSSPSTPAYIQQQQQRYENDEGDNCIDCISVVSSLSMDDSQFVPARERQRSFVPLLKGQQPKQQPAIINGHNDPPPMEVIVSTDEHVSLKVSGNPSYKNVIPDIPTTIRENSKENIFDTIAPQWLNQASDDGNKEHSDYQSGNENFPPALHKVLPSPSAPRRKIVLNPSGEIIEHSLPPPPIRKKGPSPSIPRPTLGHARSWAFSSRKKSLSFDGSDEFRQDSATSRVDAAYCFINDTTSLGEDSNPLATKGQLSDDPNDLMKDKKMADKSNILSRHRRCKSGNSTSIGSLSQGYSTLITVPTTTTAEGSITSKSTAGDSFKQAQRVQHKLLSYTGEEDGSACCRIHHEKSFYARRRGNFMKRLIVNATTSTPKIPSILKNNPISKGNKSVDTTRKSAGRLT